MPSTQVNSQSVTFLGELDMRRIHKKRAIVACMLLASASSVPALAGGLILYETGTAEIGLGSAGYGARAQDASTVLTNPAGMTRLEGSQVLLGAQVLYAGYGFSIGSGTSPALGTNDGGTPIGWFPGGGAYFTYSLSPDLKLGFAATGNFGLSEKYDDQLGRSLLHAGGDARRPVDAAFDRVPR